MNPGYVYILINPSLPDLIKIGKSVRDPRKRARELSTTGVPAPFQVAFQTFSEDGLISVCSRTKKGVQIIIRRTTCK